MKEMCKLFCEFCRLVLLEVLCSVCIMVLAIYTFCFLEELIMVGIPDQQNNWKFETSNFKYSHQI
ncbi:hypothetical protein RchiOBHm_Chr7g0230801 [Rosa chinensis]|uniref:Uncharacterized protein n=1 Tax=Rosa chinensis TaxID=74649 RepID=A0A2P6PFI6_ROSCH|nr:hypothetical protein RchiOBHm_Chr7g0230801 [Rosa chinensis]